MGMAWGGIGRMMCPLHAPVVQMMQTVGSIAAVETSAGAPKSAVAAYGAGGTPFSWAQAAAAVRDEPRVCDEDVGQMSAYGFVADEQLWRRRGWRRRLRYGENLDLPTGEAPGAARLCGRIGRAPSCW